MIKALMEISEEWKLTTKKTEMIRFEQILFFSINNDTVNLKALYFATDFEIKSTKFCYF